MRIWLAIHLQSQFGRQIEISHVNHAETMVSRGKLAVLAQRLLSRIAGWFGARNIVTVSTSFLYAHPTILFHRVLELNNVKSLI